ncbi:MAG: carboxypeptidase-like regulatory domain-containing protein [Candidatus Aminicenantes bacterium]|nr:carboxypeptidase-like regulatory domain-containing protein [Candidatus Aminicenantes bacterium]
MKKFLALLFCVSFALALGAQERTGNISGTVTDDQGNALPGVSLTLTGSTIGAIPMVSSAEGKFRFLSLFPGSDYAIKAELQGFKTKSQTGIIVNINRTSDIRIAMEQGGIEEQITVIAQTPIVDTKKTQITHTVSYEMLQSLPSARDPWVVLQMTPSVQMDRENIGGVESGQQSYFQAKGTTNNEWTLDGMQTTDKSSVSSAGYYDFDSFEELNISTGTLDVEHKDPAVVINVVTRRGTNKTSLGGRFFYTDSKFQSVVPQSRLDEFGVASYNRVNDIKDFGFNAGGPFVKDKAWWWISYGIQQVKTYNQLNVADDTYLNNYNAKLNFQIIPSNRLELLYMLGDKKKYGRSSADYHPPGLRQGSKQHFGNPTMKLQDEQMFGDSLFLSVRL